MRLLSLFIYVAMLANCSSCQTIGPTVDERGNESVCRVHGTILKDDTVRTSLAIVDYSRAYYNAREALFPSANDEIHRYHQNGRAYVRYCPECRAAKAAWIREH